MNQSLCRAMLGVKVVLMSFKLCNQQFNEGHLCVLAAPPSTFRCTLTHAHIMDNASLHIQGRVTIGYLASQPCQAHNESLRQWTRLLPSAIQMGV